MGGGGVLTGGPAKTITFISLFSYAWCFCKKILVLFRTVEAFALQNYTEGSVTSSGSSWPRSPPAIGRRRPQSPPVGPKCPKLQCMLQRRHLRYTDKKGNKIFLIYKEILRGAVATSYMRKGFLIYEEMRKYFPIYEEAVSHI
jgi:hypothetical protein